MYISDEELVKLLTSRVKRTTKLKEIQAKKEAKEFAHRISRGYVIIGCGRGGCGVRVSDSGGCGSGGHC